MGRLFRFVFWLLLIGVLFSPVILAWFVLDDTPIVGQEDSLVFSDVKDLKGVAKRFDPRQMDASTTTDVVASEDELSSALMAALSSTGFARGKITVSPLGIVASAT